MLPLILAGVAGAYLLAKKTRRNPGNKRYRRGRRRAGRQARIGRRVINDLISEGATQSLSRSRRRTIARLRRRGVSESGIEALNRAHRKRKRRNPVTHTTRSTSKRRRKGWLIKTTKTVTRSRAKRNPMRASQRRRILARVRSAARRNKRSRGAARHLYRSVAEQTRAGRMLLGREWAPHKAISAAVQRGIAAARRNPKRRRRSGVTPGGAASRLAHWRWHHNPSSLPDLNAILKHHGVKKFVHTRAGRVAIRKGGRWLYFARGANGYERTGDTLRLQHNPSPNQLFTRADVKRHSFFEGPTGKPMVRVVLNDNRLVLMPKRMWDSLPATKPNPLKRGRSRTVRRNPWTWGATFWR